MRGERQLSSSSPTALSARFAAAKSRSVRLARTARVGLAQRHREGMISAADAMMMLCPR